MAGTTNSQVKAILRQLDKDQLTKLARQNKKFKGTISDLTKPKMVEFLSHAFTKKEINELLTKHGRTGDKAVIDGMVFERKAMNRIRKEGFECKLNDIDIPHMEFDIIGYKRKRFLLDVYEWWAIVECKNKAVVTMRDFTKFHFKYLHFMKLKKETPEYCKGFMVTSGYFDPTVKKMAKAHGIKLIPLR
jgi:hypothetical protein